MCIVLSYFSKTADAQTSLSTPTRNDLTIDMTTTPLKEAIVNELNSDFTLLASNGNQMIYGVTASGNATGGANAFTDKMYLKLWTMGANNDIQPTNVVSRDVAADVINAGIAANNNLFIIQSDMVIVPLGATKARILIIVTYNDGNLNFSPGYKNYLLQYDVDVSSAGVITFNGLTSFTALTNGKIRMDASKTANTISGITGFTIAILGATDNSSLLSSGRAFYDVIQSNNTIGGTALTNIVANYKIGSKNNTVVSPTIYTDYFDSRNKFYDISITTNGNKWAVVAAYTWVNGALNPNGDEIEMGVIRLKSDNNGIALPTIFGANVGPSSLKTYTTGAILTGGSERFKLFDYKIDAEETTTNTNMETQFCALASRYVDEKIGGSVYGNNNLIGLECSNGTTVTVFNGPTAFNANTGAQYCVNPVYDLKNLLSGPSPFCHYIFGSNYGSGGTAPNMAYGNSVVISCFLANLNGLFRKVNKTPLGSIAYINNGPYTHAVVSACGSKVLNRHTIFWLDPNTNKLGFKITVHNSGAYKKDNDDIDEIIMSPIPTLSIFPNPALNESVTFTLPAQKGDLQIIDVFGKVVKEISIASYTYTLPHCLPSGNYIARFNDIANNNRFTSKFVIQ
jgi:hypothetical protein